MPKLPSHIFTVHYTPMPEDVKSKLLRYMYEKLIGTIEERKDLPEIPNVIYKELKEGRVLYE